jgi:uncharacterized protein
MRALIALAAWMATATACAGAPSSSAAEFPELRQVQIEAETASGTHRFAVWIAADDRSRERGLMFVRQLAPDRGMLFVFDFPQQVAFWMKDTVLSLDLVFIDPTGTVLCIARDAEPYSLDPIDSRGPVIAVLEVLAGTARRIGLVPGDRIVLPSLRTTWTPARSPPPLHRPRGGPSDD